MLCALCTAIFRKSDHSGTHHAAWDHLILAAKSGCKICSVVKEEKANFLHERGYTGGPLFYHLYYYPWNNTSQLYISHSLQETAVWGRAGPWCVVVLHPSDDLPLSDPHDEHLRLVQEDLLHSPWRVRKDFFYRQFPANTSHRSILDLAIRWFRKCETGHPSCASSNGTEDSHWSPKRLLGLSNNRKLRLVEKGSGFDSSTPYASLSHCWGGAEFLRLEDRTEHHLKEGFSTKEAPKSFRDAVMITIKLGLRHLWIDSLCILQAGPGSREDWEEHVSDMKLVYLNAVINISLDRARNPHDGAFVERDTNRIQPCHVLWNHDGQNGMWTIIDRLRDGEVHLLQSPLQERAWVYQERLLSPRILHFGSEQVMWECREGQLLSEMLPDCHPSLEAHRHFPFTIPQPSNKRLTRSGKKSQNEEVSEAWWRMVDDYIRRSLSFPAEDKLAAFAGAAQRFGVFYNDEHVAGFFRQHLPAGLIWEADLDIGGRRPIMQADDPYRAPTWSWVSVDGPVHLPDVSDPSNVDLAHIDSVEVALVDERNNYGPLKSAALSLSCVLMPCRFKKDDELGIVLVPLPQDNFDESFGKPISQCNHSAGVDDLRYISGEGNTFMVPISGRLEDEGVWGIILRVSESNSTFERIGRYDVEGYGHLLREILRLNRKLFQQITLV